MHALSRIICVDTLEYSQKGSVAAIYSERAGKWTPTVYNLPDWEALPIPIVTSAARQPPRQHEMTDLLRTIPDFPTKLYTHLLPSLEKNLITTTDLLTLDALEVAKRAQLPLLDVRRLSNHVLATLQTQLGLENADAPKFEDVGEGKAGYGSLKSTGEELGSQWSTISTLDPALDAALGGGIPTGYITEITGER